MPCPRCGYEPTYIGCNVTGRYGGNVSAVTGCWHLDVERCLCPCHTMFTAPKDTPA